MKIKEQLLAEGFQRYKDSTVTDKQCYDESYQLQMLDDKGVKYFINIDLYDYRKADWHHNLPSPLLDDLQGTYQVQFNTRAGHVFDVNFTANTPKQAVAFFDKMFYAMGCSYYQDF